MTSSARSLFEVGPLSGADLERIIAALPASKRAQLAWAPRAIRAAVGPLHLAPLSGELVARCAEDVARATIRLVPDLVEFLTLERLRTELEGTWRANAERVRDFLADDVAANAFEYATRTVIGALDAVSVWLTPDEVEKIKQAAGGTFDQLAAEIRGDAGALLRLQALLFAITEAERTGEHLRDRARELSYLAFEEAIAALRGLAVAGVHVDPYRGETVDERTSRVLRYAKLTRQSLSDAEFDVLTARRLESL